MDSIKFEQQENRVPVIVLDKVKLVSQKIAEDLESALAQHGAFLRLLVTEADEYKQVSVEEALRKAVEDNLGSKSEELKRSIEGFALTSVSLDLIMVGYKTSTDEEFVLAYARKVDAATEVIFQTYKNIVQEAINPSCKSWVYFLLNKDRGMVKIGYSGNPEYRVNTFRAGTIDELVLLKTMPGGRSEESQMHKKFKKYRVKKEWFKYTGELKKFIDSLPLPQKP